MKWTHSVEWREERRNGQRGRGWRERIDGRREGENLGGGWGDWRLEAGSVEV